LRHGYGLKINGSCYGNARRFTPMRSCNAYITFDNSELNLANTDFTQAANLTRVRKSQFDNTVKGLPYNCTPIQPTTTFPTYYFDKTEVESWGVRGVGCNEDFSSCTMRFRGPRFRNNLVVIPLRKHTLNPLKQGRLTYDFLDSNPNNTHSPIFNLSDFSGELDPLEFSGFYPYSPDDNENIKKPAGWMYSNRSVPEPYLTQRTYENGGSSVDRSTAKRRKQIDFLPFVDPLRVFDINEHRLGQFDGLAFVVLFGEMAFKLPIVDLPEYQGVLKDFTEATNNLAPPYMDPAWQYMGVEVNIFLAGDGIPSPRIGRQRFMLPNRQGPSTQGFGNDPAGNYFTLFFKPFVLNSIDMTMDFAIKPSQVIDDDPSVLPSKLPFSNMNIMIGA
jgi:hypothetical protein